LSTQFVTITSTADTLTRIRSHTESALAVLEECPKNTQWPDLNAEIEKAEEHLTNVLNAMNDSITVNDVEK